ncbi:MAG: nucleoside triphosphate pyrophosphohydrolase [Ginsengibacter sp.]
MNQLSTDFSALIKIMDELREKCPWDKKQTIQTLRQQTIEETFELVDAITEENWGNIKEELGDLLLHVIFYSKIAAEKNKFSLQEVVDGICQKLISRHPHIYGDVKVNDEEEVKRNWEQIKLKEGKTSVLGGVPKSLPSMVKAMRIQEKAKQVGFEWEQKEQVWEKVKEEEQELFEAIESGKQSEIENEMGDLLFSIINYSRFLNVDPENALELTNKKFLSRFTNMEMEAAQKGQMLHDMSLDDMEKLWINAKSK